MRTKILALLLAPFLTVSPTAGAQPFSFESTFVDKQVVNLTVRPGVIVRYLAGTSIFVPPTRAVILFAGGNGLLGMTPTGAITTDLQLNFLVRSRWIFAHRGLYVAVVDTPGAITINGDRRLSAQYSEDVGKVIQDVRTRSGGLPVWLVGTSSGTISAASVAARRPLVSGPVKANLSRPDGIVLTATQTQTQSMLPSPCLRTVFNAKLTNINVPAFATAHKNDGCDCSPPKDMSAVLAALAHSPVKGSQLFAGGLPQASTDECQALTPHGFYGVDNPVISAIATWIKTH